MERVKERALFLTVVVAVLVLVFQSPVAGQTSYQKPPKEVLDILNAPPPPMILVSPSHDRVLIIESLRYPPIADVAEPMLRLAGLRINPNTNGPHRAPRVIGLSIKGIEDGREQKIALPANARLGFPRWSPDGKRFAVENTTATGVELWVGDAASATIRRLPGLKINAAYGDPFQWMPDSATLLCQSVVAGRGPVPVAPKVPAGPNVQESHGKLSPIRTYQDLLKTPFDETLFEYYATSQLMLVDIASGKTAPIGKPAIFARVDAAPDSRHILVVRTIRPYSFLHPAEDFPKEVEVIDRGGLTVYKVASLPLEDQVPIEGAPTGPRGYEWRPTEPATLVWVEALDGGNPKTKAPYRDKVMLAKAPFSGAPAEVAKTQHRYSGITFGEKNSVALLSEFDRDRRWRRTHLVNLDAPGAPGKLLFDLSSQDRYNDPGRPVTHTLPNGFRAILQKGDDIYLDGNGATPKGDRPFLNRFNLQTLKTETLFRCDDNSYEDVLELLDDNGTRFITRRETVTEPPNYYVRQAGASDRRPLTSYRDPAPQLKGVRKEIVRYKRADGVGLSFTLYLPPGYKEGTPLPTVVWAYPLEFTDAGTAGQVSGSANRFTTITGYSHLFFLTQGYAVLDGATMPIVGDPETVNNTYVEQIIASARAAIDKAVQMGVTDRNRVGVGGHSYGAFMTANLLAHCDLFRAGIARSGAYNRTLTPFGFQSERRTLWEAPETYLKVSPFMYADKIKEPILLIHGEADDNTGTFPIQSERMYQAIKGNGGNVRYVTLPSEAHGYSARESTEHVLWEMINWFEKYVKNAGS
jgi:dipeptidyl aminopeptidase/acylaminoacyl peptidase